MRLPTPDLGALMRFALNCGKGADISACAGRAALAPARKDSKIKVRMIPARGRFFSFVLPQ